MNAIQKKSDNDLELNIEESINEEEGVKWSDIIIGLGQQRSDIESIIENNPLQ